MPSSAEFPPRANLYDNLSTVLGLAHIVPEGATFRLAEDGEDGELAVVQPLTSSGRPGDVELLDLVAWRPAHPSRWWLYTGLGTFLGPWPPAAADLRLTATPLAWLGDPESVCLVAFGSRTLEDLLAFRRVTVDDGELAGFLRHELVAAFIPAVEVRP